MRIAIITREFDGVMGGLERQIVTISNLLTKNGHEILIVSLDVSDGTTYFTNFGEKIEVVGIGVSSPKVRANTSIRLQRQLKLYRLLHERDIKFCFAFMIGSLYLARIPTLFSGIPLVLCERNSPSMYSFIASQRYRVVRFISMLSASLIVVQFESYITKYPKYLQSKIRAIPNSVSNLPVKTQKNREKLMFSFAGRFSFQKQLIRLIRGFNLYCTNGGTANLELIGLGEERNQISKMILELKLIQRISMRDPNPDIALVLKDSDLLCLFSLWEGFPNVLAEALAMGIPGIGFKQCDGVNELLSDGKNGILIEDDGSDICIAQGLMKAELLLANGKLSQIECASSISAYTEEVVKNKWLQLLNEYD